MTKKFRIVLWFLVGLFVASVASIALFLTSVSPIRGEFKIETVTIAASSQTPVRMTWRDFTCESGSGFDRCMVPLPTGNLEVAVSYEKYAHGGWSILDCQATHAGENVACDGMLLGNLIGGVRFLGSIQIGSNLSLSDDQLQTLRKENWFAQWNQNNPSWYVSTVIFAIAASLLFGLLLWQYPSRPAKILTAITVGLGSFYFFALLPSGLYWLIVIAANLFDPQNPGLPQPIDRGVSWMFSLVVHLSTSVFGVIVFGVIVAIATVATLTVLWQRTELKMPPTFAIMGGASAFFLVNLMAYSFLVSYGFVQADY